MPQLPMLSRIFSCSWLIAKTKPGKSLMRQKSITGPQEREKTLSQKDDRGTVSVKTSPALRRAHCLHFRVLPDNLLQFLHHCFAPGPIQLFFEAP